jgi:hypothetical protein
VISSTCNKRGVPTTNFQAWRRHYNNNCTNRGVCVYVSYFVFNNTSS